MSRSGAAAEAERPVRVDFRVRRTGSAIVFIHGFLGHAAATWGDFPQLLMERPELAHWDVLSIGYSSNLHIGIGKLWSSDASLDVLGYYLRTMLQIAPFDAYSKLALVTHSMGGLVAQQAMLDAHTRSRVSHLFLFATPSGGAGKANPFRRVHQQAHDMALGSEFITRLRAAWPAVYVDGKAFVLRAIAGERDAYVLPSSSLDPFPEETRFVVPGDHLTMVKPKEADSPSLQIVLQGLLGVGSLRANGEMPHGTVVFLFSDIEGSTQRWEERTAAMPDAMRLHDEIMRGAIETNGGRVFKTLGDGVCAVFWRAPDAVRAALDAQKGITAADWAAVGGLRVRIALHAGSVEEREGDYLGPAVNRVARLLAVTHGGQVVVSGTTARLLRGAMPASAELRDLGEHRLKDLVDPERVWQLWEPGLVETFPPLRSLESLPNNLPRQLTGLVGRDEVLSKLATLVASSPLVTIVGAGGVGKTRVALQVGAELLDGSAGGVWFVDLAGIVDPGLVAATMGATLGVREQPQRPALETLIAYLERKRLLVILDNCEHLVDEVARVSQAILRTCPDVRILATSREPLRLGGEHVYRLPSLSVPLGDWPNSAQAALRYDSVALFVERAKSADIAFALTDEAAPIVAEICRRLDGIPLAIELAAARVKVLAPRQLRQKLADRFRVLTGGSRATLPRQQTMRALIDWSYDLLSDEERALFRKLGVFEGSITLQSACAVCGDDALDELAILDLLSSLVDKSLVHAETIAGEIRYRLLETTKQYACERLGAAGEYDRVALAHLTAFLAFAEELDASYESTDDSVWYERAQLEFDNLFGALDWALKKNANVELGQRLAGALRHVWLYSSARGAGRYWVDLAKRVTGPESGASVHAHLDLTAAALAIAYQEYESARVLSERAATAFDELEDPLRLAYARRYAGYALTFLGRTAEAEAILREALRVAREVGAGKLASAVLQGIATVHHQMDDPAGARAFYAEALASARTSGSQNRAAIIATDLAEVELLSGNPSGALELTREPLTAWRGHGDRIHRALTLSNVSAYLIALDRFDEARRAAREALQILRDVRYDLAAACVLQHLAAAGALEKPRTASDDRRGKSAELLGYVNARFSALSARRQYTEQQELDRVVTALRDSLGADRLAKHLEDGAALTEEQAAAIALA